MTYAEFVSMAEGALERERRQYNHAVEMAWLGAVLPRQKEIPPLRALLIPERAKETDARPDDALLFLRVLNAAFGGEEV